jgi:hypothetical protein
MLLAAQDTVTDLIVDAGGVGVGVDSVEDVIPPPHPIKDISRTRLQR